MTILIAMTEVSLLMLMTIFVMIILGFLSMKQ